MVTRSEIKLLPKDRGRCGDTDGGARWTGLLVNKDQHGRECCHIALLD